MMGLIHKKMDKNKDGKADLEELKGYMKAVTSIGTLHGVRRTMERWNDVRVLQEFYSPEDVKEEGLSDADVEEKVTTPRSDSSSRDHSLDPCMM